MIFPDVVAALSFSGATYLWRGVSPVQTAMDTVDARMRPAAPPMRERLVQWTEHRARRVPFYNQAVRDELDRVQGPASRYLTQVLLFGLVGALAAGEELTWWLIPLGAAIGMMVPRLLLMIRYHRWLQQVLTDTPDLVTILSARFQSGDTVPQAIIGAADQLSGPLGQEWHRIASLVQTGMPLADVLRGLGDRVHDRDFDAVLAQLLVYDRESVPAEPFGSLSAHLDRLKLLRREYMVKRSTSTVTILAGVAMMTAMICLIGPMVYILWTQALTGLPI